MGVSGLDSFDSGQELLQTLLNMIMNLQVK